MFLTNSFLDSCTVSFLCLGWERVYRPRVLGQLVDVTHAASPREVVRASRVAAGVLKPCFSTNQAWLWHWRKAVSAACSSATVSKVRIHRSCSLSVRMKRSGQPLPSGSRTNAGEDSVPRKRSSA